MLSRRELLKGLAVLTAGGAGFGGYALAEPFRLNVTRYALSPPGWPQGFSLRLAILADLHACHPWMPPERIRQIVARTNALAPDVTLLLGDFIVSNRLARIGRRVENDLWAGELGRLVAPLGVHAVLGNHDWWPDVEAAIRRERKASWRSMAQRERIALAREITGFPVAAHAALERAGIKVYHNDALRLAKDGQPFWLAGLGDQWAYWPALRGLGMRPSDVDAASLGTDDLAATLGKVHDDAPAILMAHEPDVFPSVPSRVALTVSGHTHGGQVRLMGFSPVIPSRYGRRFDYGHIVEKDGEGGAARAKNLIVSGGLGCSGIPVRFGMPPEIVVVELGGAASAAAVSRQPAAV